MKRYDPIQRFQQGGHASGEMEERADGDYVKEADLLVTRHNVISVTWEDGNTTIVVEGTIEPVRAGDSVVYLKASSPASE